MRRIGLLVAVAMVTVLFPKSGHAQDGGAPPLTPTPWMIYDVTAYGANGPGATTCELNREAIQSAIDAAHAAGGGIVYFPPGQYCVDNSLLGYATITLRGAGLVAFSGGNASRIVTTTDFPENTPVIKMADQSIDNYGFEVEDLAIDVWSGNEGIVGIDFSGVWYGAIRGVGVTGPIVPSPRNVVAGTIAFLFSDRYHNGPAGACFANLVDRTTVDGMETAYRFDSTIGTMSLITLTNFWVADVKYGIWTSSIGSLGLSFRDGYILGSLAVSGLQAFKHTSSLSGASISTMNVQFEGFDVPNDLPITSGALALASGDLYIGGDVSAQYFTPVLSEADGYHCGSTSACPCQPGWYPAPGVSFWASIPHGTSLTAGANTFTYYTVFHIGDATPVPDLFFTFHPTRTANIGQVFQLSGSNSVTAPYSYNVQTYTVTLFVGSNVTLSSDFIFFLEANQSKPYTAPGSCLYPPS